MGDAQKILCVVGTRPEAIKMAPVISELKKRTWADVRVLATAQHRELLDQVLTLFKIKPHSDLNIMSYDQALPELTANLLVALDGSLAQEAPDLVLAQGDTTTVFMTALASFYRRIPFGHVEAGLRTGDLNYPFPEETNRILADHITRIHFAPTGSAKENLLREGIKPDSIHVTGNTVIDALLEVAGKGIRLGQPVDPQKRLLLVTAHRRENFGSPLREICMALRELAKRNEDIQILYPVHPNPNIHDTVHEVLEGNPKIILADPMDYGPFISAMKQSYLILTDSGGIQEEAPALGKPVLVLRGETERPEAVAAGVVRLVGTNQNNIINATQRLLDDETLYQSMAKGISPYGDGRAAERIADILEESFKPHEAKPS